MAVSLNTGQTVVSSTLASLIGSFSGPATITLINNNASGAIAVGQSTAVSMSNSATTGNFAGALIPAGQQVTFTLAAATPTYTLYAIGGAAGTLSSFISTGR